MDAGSSPRVFISYAEDSDVHLALVGRLHSFLRASGVDARLDLLEAGKSDLPVRALPDDVVVVMVSPAYKNIIGSDLFVAEDWRSWAGERILASATQAQKLLLLVPPGGTPEDIPEPLRTEELGYFSFEEFSPEVFATLLWSLFGEWRAPAPMRARTGSLRRAGKAAAGPIARLTHIPGVCARKLKRVAGLANAFVDRISNWFVWAVGGGITPLVCIWILNFRKESHPQELLGGGELFIVSAVLVAATYGELLRERLGRSAEAAPGEDGEKAEVTTSGARKLSWPSQMSRFACFASALGAVAGYGGVIVNGPKVTMYLSLAVFFLTLVTGAFIMNGIEKDR